LCRHSLFFFFMVHFMTINGGALFKIKNCAETDIIKTEEGGNLNSVMTVLILYYCAPLMCRRTYFESIMNRFFNSMSPCTNFTSIVSFLCVKIFTTLVPTLGSMRTALKRPLLFGHETVSYLVQNSLF